MWMVVWSGGFKVDQTFWGIDWLVAYLEVVEFEDMPSEDVGMAPGTGHGDGRLVWGV